MKKIFIVIAFVLSFSAKAQIRLVHINAEFNQSNDWYGLEVVDGIKVYNGYIDKSPGIQKKYNITKVPTLILYRDGKEIERWEAGLDMKLHVSANEIQKEIDSL